MPEAQGAIEVWKFQRMGWCVSCGQGHRCEYLCRDGRWRRHCDVRGRRSGYHETEEQARAVLAKVKEETTWT